MKKILKILHNALLLVCACVLFFVAHWLKQDVELAAFMMWAFTIAFGCFAVVVFIYYTLPDKYRLIIKKYITK